MNAVGPVEPTELYLVCPKCHVMSFNLVALVPEVGQATYEVHCAGCDAIVTATLNPDGSDNPEFQWARNLPELTPAETADLSLYANTVSTGSAELAKRRTLRNIEKWSDENVLAVVGGYSTLNGSSFWMDFENEGQRQWVIRKLEEMITNVKGWNNG